MRRPTTILALCISLAASAGCNGAHESPGAPTNLGLTSAAPTITSSLTGKLFVGYQGWFAAPGDGSPVNNWQHWSYGVAPAANTLTVDLWPDTSEYDPSALFTAGSLLTADGSPSKLFSSYASSVTDLHFQWMQQYLIDGAVMQRFVVGPSVPTSQAFGDHVMQNAIASSAKYGRQFFVEFDISGSWKLPDCYINGGAPDPTRGSANPDYSVAKCVEADWMHLVDQVGVTRSSQYFQFDGQPLVGIFGIGFGGGITQSVNDGSSYVYSPADAAELLAWFTSTAPPQYRAKVFGGVPTWWRTLTGDSLSDPAWASVYKSFSVLSPWMPGRYGDATTFAQQSQQVSSEINAVAKGDLAAATANGQVYLPVIFPGSAWHNLQDNAGSDPAPPNAIPRFAGQFLWTQAAQLSAIGVTGFFGAMFDECDESTAMFKAAPTMNSAVAPLQQSGSEPYQAYTLTLDADGFSLPSDWYLQVLSSISIGIKGLVGGGKLSPTLPLKPSCAQGQVYAGGSCFSCAAPSMWLTELTGFQLSPGGQCFPACCAATGGTYPYDECVPTNNIAGKTITQTLGPPTCINGFVSTSSQIVTQGQVADLPGCSQDTTIEVLWGPCECNSPRAVNPSGECVVPCAGDKVWNGKWGQAKVCSPPTCADEGEVGTWPNCHPTCADEGLIGIWPNCHSLCPPGNDCT